MDRFSLQARPHAPRMLETADQKRHLSDMRINLSVISRRALRVPTLRQIWIRLLAMISPCPYIQNPAHWPACRRQIGVSKSSTANQLYLLSSLSSLEIILGGKPLFATKTKLHNLVLSVRLIVHVELSAKCQAAGSVSSTMQ